MTKYRIVTRAGKFRIQYQRWFFDNWNFLINAKKECIEFDSGDDAIDKVRRLQEVERVKKSIAEEEWVEWETDAI